jgi:hypothetical protein
MEMAPASRVLGRRLRRRLSAPDDVLVVFAGPPTLSLDRRTDLLRACRMVLTGAGYAVEVLGGWRNGVQATGEEAEAILDRDERMAEAGKHWWLHNFHWSADGRGAHVVSRWDPDGMDLLFCGWGNEVESVLTGLERILEAHHP